MKWAAYIHGDLTKFRTEPKTSGKPMGSDIIDQTIEEETKMYSGKRKKYMNEKKLLIFLNKNYN